MFIFSPWLSLLIINLLTDLNGYSYYNLSFYKLALALTSFFNYISLLKDSLIDDNISLLFFKYY